MARGWESKSVESQIESAGANEQKNSGPSLTQDQLNRQREIESLQLTRTRVLHDLSTATHDRYRQSLELALKYLEEKIAGLS